MLSVSDLLLVVYVLVDDLFTVVVGERRLRSRGVSPKLSDAEVITIELVGEILGIDSDKGIWNYIRQHWLSLFPDLPSRSRFVRQAADLWKVKQQMHVYLIALLGVIRGSLHIIDGFPVPVCRRARASRCQRFAGEVALGYCASQKSYYYGFKGHLVTDDAGVIVSLLLTAATVDDRAPLLGLADPLKGVLLGDKGYIDEQKWAWLWQRGVQLKTPRRKNMAPRPAADISAPQRKRRKVVETVISQLNERFHIGKVRARDAWHLTSRIARKAGCVHEG